VSQQKKSEDPKIPCAPDAERSLLGAMLVDQENALKAFSVMKGEEFFTDTNRLVFRAMQSLAGESKPIGIVELVDELNRSQMLTRAGGAAYISSLVDGMPRVVNVESYAKMVCDTYKLRRLLYFAEEVKTLVDGKGQVEEVVEAAVQKLLDISA
jgi:replicative DNA helicase